MLRELDIRFFENPARGAIEFFIWSRNPRDGTVAIADPLTLRECKPMAMDHSPTGYIERGDAACLQNLMDNLWNLGIRPKLAKAGDAQIEAMNRHLQDMRHLAFKGQPPNGR